MAKNDTKRVTRRDTAEDLAEREQIKRNAADRDRAWREEGWQSEGGSREGWGLD